MTDIPSRFVFRSRIIFCANRVPRRNEIFAALLSRCDIFTLHATAEELLDQMRCMASEGYGSLSPDQCHEVVSFIEKTAGSRRISMRLYEPSLKKVEYALKVGVDWRPLVGTQLDEIGDAAESVVENSRSYELDCLRRVMADYGSVAEQEEAWCRMVRKSRASFFRWKRALMQVTTGDEGKTEPNATPESVVCVAAS